MGVRVPRLRDPACAGDFGKWPYYVPHVRDFEGLSPYCGAHAKAAKEDWILGIGSKG